MMLAISTACRHPPASARPGRTPTTGRRVIPAVMAGRRARAVAVRSVDDAKDDGSSAEVDARADEEAEQPRRTFGSDVEAIAARGLAGALPEVDARLRIAMGEAAGSRSDTDADALDAKRAAARAEDQAVDIVACLKQTGALRGYGAARLVPRRDYALSELKLNGIEAEKLLSPTESTISGLRDVLGRVALVSVGAWVLSSHPSGAQVTGVLAPRRRLRWTRYLAGGWRRSRWTRWRRRRAKRTSSFGSTRRRTFSWRTSWAYSRRGTRCPA